ncbi:MAG: PAC2 family protein [archaeon]
MKPKNDSRACDCTVELIETKNVSLRGYTLLEGFPGLGLSGTIGSKYIVEKLRLEQIGHINSEKFLPIIRIENGLPMHPVRIYASKKNKLAIILAEQVVPKESAADVAKEFVDWVKKKGIKTVISTSGIRTDETTKVYAFASNENSKKIISNNGIKLISNGITSGVTALIMLELKENNIDALCIMGNTKTSADYHAAKEIVKAICKITGLKIDLTSLEKEGRTVEDSLVEHLKTVKENSCDESDITPMYA